MISEEDLIAEGRFMEKEDIKNKLRYDKLKQEIDINLKRYHTVTKSLFEDNYIEQKEKEIYHDMEKLRELLITQLSELDKIWKQFHFKYRLSDDDKIYHKEYYMSFKSRLQNVNVQKEVKSCGYPMPIPRKAKYKKAITRKRTTTKRTSLLNKMDRITGVSKIKKQFR